MPKYRITLSVGLCISFGVRELLSGLFNRSCAQVRPLKTKASLVQDADKHQGPEIFRGTFSAVKVFKTWVGSSHGESHGR